MRLRDGAAVAVMMALAACAAGCGKPVLRVADASLGDYYTDEEFKRLRKEQREEYCTELARQDSVYRAELLDTREAMDALRARSRTLRGEGDSLLALASGLESRIEAVSAARAGTPAGGPANGGEVALTGVHVVRPGESLWRISRSGRVYGSGAGWRRIYEENRERIRDPNLIFPGQELTIPR